VYRRRFQLWDSFLTLLLPDRLGMHHPPPAWSPSRPTSRYGRRRPGRSRPTHPLEFPRFKSDTRCARLALAIRPKADGEEVLDLGFLDHSVNSADRAANLSSDSRDGEAGCSESGDLGMPLSLGANDAQAQDLVLRASLGVCAQSRRRRAPVARS
jgi:hypothetical protein